MSDKVRVTVDPGYYDQHSDSVELWSPGNPIFADGDIFCDDGSVSLADFLRVTR